MRMAHRKSAADAFANIATAEATQVGHDSGVTTKESNERTLWMVSAVSLSVHGLFCLLLAQYGIDHQTVGDNVATTVSFDQAANDALDSIEVLTSQTDDTVQPDLKNQLATVSSALHAIRNSTHDPEPKFPDLGVASAAPSDESQSVMPTPTVQTPDTQTAKFKNRFFGKEFDGESVVFVLDASSSMQGQPFRRAITELQASLKQMKSEQRYFVILYNEQVMRLFAPDATMDLVEATPSNRKRTIRWLRKQKPQALTDPAPALEMALKMQPSVVVLLTDGELPSGALLAARQYNRHRTTIHTLAFQSNTRVNILRAIASENQGSFRVVP